MLRLGRPTSNATTRCWSLKRSLFSEGFSKIRSSFRITSDGALDVCAIFSRRFLFFFRLRCDRLRGL